MIRIKLSEDQIKEIAKKVVEDWQKIAKENGTTVQEIWMQIFEEICSDIMRGESKEEIND